MKDKNWKLEFPETGAEVELGGFDREGVLIKMKMTEGEAFTREDVLESEDRDIIILMESEKGLLGGMTYLLDPDLEAYNETG